MEANPHLLESSIRMVRRTKHIPMRCSKLVGVPVKTQNLKSINPVCTQQVDLKYHNYSRPARLQEPQAGRSRFNRLPNPQCCSTPVERLSPLSHPLRSNRRTAYASRF